MPKPKKPSLADQIAAAAAAGDLKLVQELAAQMKAQVIETKPLKVQKPAKPKVTIQPTSKTQKKQKRGVIEEDWTNEPIEEEIYEDRPKREKGDTQARTESMRIGQRVNKWNDKLQLERADLSPKIKKLYNSYRPERRPPAKMVKVRCSGGCGKLFRVSASLITEIEDDNGRVVGRGYTCSACIRSRN